MGTAFPSLGHYNDRLEGEPAVYEDSGFADDRDQAANGMPSADDIFGKAPERQEAPRAPRVLREPKKLILDVNDQIARRNAYFKREDSRRAPTGLRTIDEAIHGGIRPGEVFGLQARSGVGKTIALCNICRRWGYVTDRLGLFYSAEMPADQVTIRMTQILHGISYHDAKKRVESGQLEDDPMYRAELANLLLVERKRLSLEELGNAIKQAEDERGVRVGMVAVDYLGLLGGKKSASTYEAMSQLAIDCKDFAGEFDLALVLAVQVSRQAGADGNKKVGMGAARDSGVIEEACDYLMSLWRNGDALAGNLAKNRHGPMIDEFRINFNRTTLELTDEWQQTAWEMAA